MIVWDEAKEAALRAGWASGLSSFQIAPLVGGVTASAVRARRRRLGLPKRSGDELVYGGVHKATPSTQKPSGLIPALIPEPDTTPVLWRDLEWSQCAFPVGDSDDGPLACGAKVPSGARRRYCPFHQASTVERPSHVAKRAA
jgi:hypothetical protein